MLIPDDIRSSIGSFIRTVYSHTFDAELIHSLVPLFRKILGSHYAGVLLFENRFISSPGYISNNTSSYASMYKSQLIKQDFLLKHLITTSSQTVLSSFASDIYKNNADFCVHAIRGRPISDLCYVPINIHGCLAGYVAVSRAGMDDRIGRLFQLQKLDAVNKSYSSDELALFSFLAGILNDAVILALDKPVSNDAVAGLSAGGTVIQAGLQIRQALQELFGPEFWNQPVQGSGPASAAFRKYLCAFLCPGPSSYCRSFELEKAGHKYRFVFRLLDDNPFYLHIPNEPVIRLELCHTFVSDSIQAVSEISRVFSKLPLSPREDQVARLIFKAYSNGEIAQELGISIPTVKRHLSTIYGKAGVSSRTQLFSRYIIQ